MRVALGGVAGVTRRVMALAMIALLTGVPTSPAKAKDEPACESAAPAGVAASCEGIGPGTFAAVDGNAPCTLNFVFIGRDGARYIGTAGHCVLPPGSKPRTWPAGRGPAVRKSTTTPLLGATGPIIGHVVYAVHQEFALDVLDFALIRLAPGVVPYTSVPYFGGPKGINRNQTSSPEVLRLFGRTPPVGDVLPARYIVARDLADKHHVFGNGHSSPGDSGGPVLDANGRALGVLLGALGNKVTTGGNGSPPGDTHGGGLIRMLRIGPAVDGAARAMRTPLRLVNGT